MEKEVKCLVQMSKQSYWGVQEDGRPKIEDNPFGFEKKGC